MLPPDFQEKLYKKQLSPPVGMGPRWAGRKIFGFDCIVLYCPVLDCTCTVQYIVYCTVYPRGQLEKGTLLSTFDLGHVNPV